MCTHSNREDLCCDINQMNCKRRKDIGKDFVPGDGVAAVAAMVVETVLAMA